METEKDVSSIKVHSFNINHYLSYFKNNFKYLGPAFVISVAYIDPGNFATNISAGSQFNYALLWVILCSNLMAIFLQTMSAKLGIATNFSLPEMCSKVFSRKTNWCFWIIAELGAMATDLAEFLGGTLGLYLLFKIPMIYSGLITGFLTFIIVYMEKYGQRVIELIISILVLIIFFSYSIEIFLAKPDISQMAIHTFIPSLPGKDSLLLAAGILGATVMPHVIYLHSGLVQQKKRTSKLKLYKMEKIDIILAMNLAFLINAAMLVVSASVFYKNGINVTNIEQAQNTLKPLLGYLSSTVFGIALLASGLSSSAVGTLAGQGIMKGFVNINLPINIRRLITMIPGMLIIVLGINPMKALLLSQVILCFILPFPVIQLLIIAGNKKIMGTFVNKKSIKLLGILISFIIILLNLMLLIFI